MRSLIDGVMQACRQSSEAARWMDAASERWDKVRETGAGGIDTAKRIGSETRGHAKSMKDKLSNTIAERTRRARETDG